jgi:hypothetical protein
MISGRRSGLAGTRPLQGVKAALESSSRQRQEGPETRSQGLVLGGRPFEGL